MKKFFVLIMMLLPFFSCTKKNQLIQNERIVYRGNGGEPDSLDPHLSMGNWDATVQRDMFLGLMTEAADGTVIAGVAQRWTISDDGLVYTFQLRKSNWSDGTPLTAEDFVFAFRRILDPQLAAKYANIMYTIKNAKAYHSGDLKDPKQIGVKAIDAQTLQIVLESPAPYFLIQLKHHTAYPLPKHIVEKFGKDWIKPKHVVSNGPFLLKEWQPQNFIKLIKNQNFYDAKNVKVDEVYFYPTEDISAALKRFRAGELDLNRYFPIEQYKWLLKNMVQETKVSPYAGTYYYAINQRLEKFQDKRVRQALSMAIDRQTIVEKVLAMGEVAAYSFVPLLDNYNNAQLNFKDISFHERVDLAKTLMQEAGYSKENPLKLQISYNSSDNHKRIAVAIATMWKEIYVEATLFHSETSVHYNNLEQGNYSIGRAAWIADYSDAQNFLMLLEYPNPLNYSSYHNPQFNKIMKQAAQTIDTKKRGKLMQQAEQLALDDFAIMPIYYYMAKNLVSKNLKGWEPNPEDIHPTRWLYK